MTDLNTYMDGHRNGMFYGVLIGSAMPFRNAVLAAKDISEAAQQITLQPNDVEQMHRHAADLEKAAKALRDAAGSAKPALRLVAAE